MNYSWLLTYSYMSFISQLAAMQSNDPRLTPNLFDRTISNSKELIIPPYLGEMGFEILWFLGSIEPWLNSGWKVLAKRPEFYPRNTAIYDEKLFSEIQVLMNNYRAKSIFSRPYIEPHRKQQASTNIPLPKIINKENNNDFECSITLPDELFQHLAIKRAFEKELKKLVGSRILHQNRPGCIPWDGLLTSAQDFLSDSCMHSFNSTLKPSYLPPDFVEPKFTYEPHIGVQLRNYREPSRNSDPNRVISSAKHLSNHLKLKILVYGHPNGTLTVDGYHSTIEESKCRKLSLLSTELSCLAQCKVMFAPSSGWCDLMAWLQIPTILEKTFYKSHWKWWKELEPRITLLKDPESILETYETLFSKKVCYPSDKSSLEEGLSVFGFNNAYFQ